MQTVWATRLRVVTAVSQRAATTFRLIDLSTDWLRETAAACGATLPEPTGDTTTLQDPRNHVQATIRRIPEPLAWRSTMTHPYDLALFTEDAVQLRTDVQIRSTDDESLVTIRQLLTSPVSAIRPFQYVVDPPSLIRTILSTFPYVYFGSTQMGLQSFGWDEHDITGLADVLRQPDRQAPILLVSHQQNGRLAYHPDDLADATAGLAQVIVLPSFQAAYDLTDAVNNRTLSCYGGAIRIYWPGFTSEDQPLTHRYWTPADISQDYLAPHQRTDFGQRIAEVLSGVAAMRVGPDEQVQALERQTERAATEALIARLRTQSAQPASLPAISAEDAVTERDLLTEAGESISVLSAENDALRERVERLQTDRLYFESRVWQMDRALRGNTPIAEDARPTFRSLGEALPWAARRWTNPHIVFADSAFRTARDSDLRPELIDKALAYIEKLCEVAGQWGNGELESFIDAFVQSGYTYRPKTSDVSAGRHPHEYFFTHDAMRWKLDPHLKTGEGKDDLSVSIYWAIDAANRRFIVGHVGSHLRDSTT